MSLGENIIYLPTRAPRKQARAAQARTKPVFQLHERARYFCSTLNRHVTGTIVQIQMDPLSGGQWRALLMTDFMTTWREIKEIEKCR